ncbi:MAG: hypothetical protein NC417_05320 [Candidatus Gastranaerophilales bacterium]|nr:hypothetical protein [Candidatus Gastranaerophilales bacterium]
MIDWEEIISAESVEELKSAKLWLFQENMRLENERIQIENEKTQIENEKREVEILNRRTTLERNRLKEENIFFDKKMAILQDGYRHLEEDRKSLEREKKHFAEERKLLTERSADLNAGDIGDILFRSVSNPLGLRKRYRDLVKIYHPDNLFGDEELSQIINKEFQRRRRDD